MIIITLKSCVVTRITLVTRITGYSHFNFRSLLVTSSLDTFSIFLPNIYLLSREGANYGKTKKKSISFNCSRKNLIFWLLALHGYGTQRFCACLSKREATTLDFSVFRTKCKSSGISSKFSLSFKKLAFVWKGWAYQN